MNWLPALGLALAVGAPGPKEAPKKAEPPSLVGEWECVEFIGGGRMAMANEVAQIGIKIEFTADGKFRGREGKREYADGKYTTDPTKDPAEVNYAAGGIPKENKGIYKVEKDTLTMCVAEGGGARPTTF